MYDQRDDRRRYAVFAVYATAFLGAAYVVGLYNFTIGSLLVTLYITWSPWHYSGQNYGVALLFLRRRGITPSIRAKQMVYACFVLPYALVFMAIHVDAGSSNYAPATYLGTEFHFMSLGIPAAVHGLLSTGVAQDGPHQSRIATQRHGVAEQSARCGVGGGELGLL